MTLKIELKTLKKKNNAWIRHLDQVHQVIVNARKAERGEALQNFRYFISLKKKLVTDILQHEIRRVHSSFLEENQLKMEERHVLVELLCIF